MLSLKTVSIFYLPSMTFFSPFLSLRPWAVRGFHTVAWVSTCPFSGSPVIKQTDSLLAELSSVTLMLGRRAGRRAIVTGPVSIMIITCVLSLICRPSTYVFSPLALALF